MRPEDHAQMRSDLVEMRKYGSTFFERVVVEFLYYIIEELRELNRKQK